MRSVGVIGIESDATFGLVLPPLVVIPPESKSEAAGGCSAGGWFFFAVAFKEAKKDEWDGGDEEASGGETSGLSDLTCICPIPRPCRTSTTLVAYLQWLDSEGFKEFSYLFRSSCFELIVMKERKSKFFRILLILFNSLRNKQLIIKAIDAKRRYLPINITCLDKPLHFFLFHICYARRR